jgi:hypothetical protein
MTLLPKMHVGPYVYPLITFPLVTTLVPHSDNFMNYTFSKTQETLSYETRHNLLVTKLETEKN